MDLYKDELLGVDADFEHADILGELEFEGEETLWGGSCRNRLYNMSDEEMDMMKHCDILYDNVIIEGKEIECQWGLYKFGEVGEEDGTFDGLGENIARLDREIWSQIENQDGED